MSNSFGSLSTLSVGGKAHSIHRLAAIEQVHPQAKKLPFSLKVLLENLLRNENGLSVRKADIEAILPVRCGEVGEILLLRDRTNRLEPARPRSRRQQVPPFGRVVA